MVVKNKQDLIYNAWVKLFGKFWVKRVSIDMIVKDVWIAKGTFYLYYKNKEELYEHIMDDVLKTGTLYMEDLVKTTPDIKERFYLHMIWSLWFFQKNVIVKNLIEWNTDYYIWKINDEYLSLKHVEFMKILLWNEFTDEEFIWFVANIKWFFSSVINHKNCFKNDKDFEDFVMNFAAVIVKWLFSDYKKIIWDKWFKEITACVPIIKK
jgi:AcrR family transcriptional regulator